MAKKPNKHKPNGMYFDTGGYEEPTSVKPPVVKPPNRQEQKQDKEEETYQWQPEPSAPAPTYSYEEVEEQEPSAPTPPPPVRVTETPAPITTPPPATKPTYSLTAQQLTSHWTGEGQNQTQAEREGISGTALPQATMITSTPSAANETGRKRDEEALFTYDGKSAERTPTPPSGGYTYQPAETPPPTESKPETSYGVKPQAATARPKTGVEAAFERQALEAERRGGFRSDADIMSAFENALTTPRPTGYERFQQNAGQSVIPNLFAAKPVYASDGPVSTPAINLNHYLSTKNYSDMSDSQRQAVNELLTRYANDHPEILTDPNRMEAVRQTMIRQVQPVQEQGQQTYQYSEPEMLATKYGIKNAYPTDPDRGKIPMNVGETSGNGTQAGQWSGKESDLPKGAVVFTPSYGQQRKDGTQMVGVKLPWREEGYSIEDLMKYNQIPASYNPDNTLGANQETFFGRYNWFEGYYRAPNGRYYPIGSGRQGKGSGPFQRIYANGGPSGGASGSGSGNAGGGQPSQTVRELDRYYNINKNWSF